MEHHVSFSFSGRYFTLGEKASAKQIWFVLHGYGQLARFFLRKFGALENRGIFVIAPEGLSRYYLEDINHRIQSGTNRVGATWMTREDRLTDIENYLSFLNAVYAAEVIPETPITLLGFSQGAATASRWATEGRIQFERLILWGGILPPDLELPLANERLKSKETVFVKGTEDPFMNEARFAEMNQLSKKLGITPKIVKHPGGHDIDEATLLSIL